MRKLGGAPAVAIAITWAITFGILAIVLLAAGGFIATSSTEGSGGRPAIFVLALVAVFPLFISTLTLRSPRWLPWLIGAISITLPVLLWFLVSSGRNETAWSVYGGLQVLRAGETFNDLAVVIRDFDCGGCAALDANYGPGLTWLKPLTFGIPISGLTTALGLVLILIMSLALAWLARNSKPLGAIALLVASVGSAWLLLLDRANLDALVFLLPIVAVLLIRWRNTWFVWAAIAALIWILGTWKYYPFGLGILLLPALKLKRGWIILLVFLIAAAAFMAVFWSDFIQNSNTYAGFTVIQDFPAVSRLAITTRMVGGSGLATALMANVIVYALVIAAITWGVLVGRRLSGVARNEAMLAGAGAVIFLGTIVVGGFGFAYKVAFLLLMLPLMAIAAQVGSKFLLYSSLVGTILILIPSTIAYSTLLTSLAGIIAASIGLGASVVVLLRYVWPQNLLLSADLAQKP